NGGTLQCMDASEGGDYIVTIKDNNGCTGVSLPLTVKVIIPPTVTASASGILTCVTNAVTIMANNCTGSGITYTWEGPGGFTSTDQHPTITDSGTYIVIVTNLTNGCTSTSSTHISKVMLHTTGACSDEGLITDGFELDGNAVSAPPDRPDDWDLVYTGKSN